MPDKRRSQLISLALIVFLFLPDFLFVSMSFLLAFCYSKEEINIVYINYPVATKIKLKLLFKTFICQHKIHLVIYKAREWANLLVPHYFSRLHFLNNLYSAANKTSLICCFPMIVWEISCIYIAVASRNVFPPTVTYWTHNYSSFRLKSMLCSLWSLLFHQCRSDPVDADNTLSSKQDTYYFI